MVNDDHSEVTGTCTDVAAPDSYRVGCNHSGSGIAFRRNQGDSCLKFPCGIKEEGSFLRKASGSLTGREYFGKESVN